MESCLITPPSITAKYWRLRTNYHTGLAGANGSFYNRNGEYGLYDTYQFDTLPEGSMITSHPDQLNTDAITSDNSSLTGWLNNIYNGIYKEQGGSTNNNTHTWHLTFAFTDTVEIKQLLMNGPADGVYMCGLDKLNIEYSDDNITWNAIGQEINVYEDMVTKYGGATSQTNNQYIHSWQYLPETQQWTHIGYYESTV